MSDEGVSFSIDFPTTGQASVDAMSASLVALEAHGNAASKAVVASSDAIKAGEASYSRAEKSADTAAKALERIGVAAQAQRGKLQFAVSENDAAAAEKAAKQLRYLAQQETEAKSRVEQANAALKAQAEALDKMGRAQGKANEATEGGEIKLGALARGLNKIGGPLGETGAKAAELVHAWERVQGSLGSTGAIVGATVAIVAVAAAILAVTAAAVEGVVKLAAWAVGLANANRSALLLEQGIARSARGGEQLDDSIATLTKRLPLTREELQGTAEKLANAGLRGNALTTALEKSAIAAAKLKFGPNFEQQMLSIDEQSKVFHENIANLFGGLKIEPLLRGLQKLGELFDADTESGKAIKVVFESLFQPIVDGATGAVPKVERFFIQLEILTLKALLAIKPYGSTILKIGEALAIGAAVIVGVFVVAIGAAVAAVAALVGLLGGLVFGLYKLVTNVPAVGRAIIAGLVNGITGGAKAVVDAMKNTVQGAIDGAKKLLGIASPSKVFAEIGMQTGAGMETGVKRSAGGVRDSLETMVSPPAAGGQGGGAAAAGATSSSRTVGDVNITINGVAGAEDVIEKIKEALTRILEGDAAQIGAVAPG